MDLSEPDVVLELAEPTTNSDVHAPAADTLAPDSTADSNTSVHTSVQLNPSVAGPQTEQSLRAETTVAGNASVSTSADQSVSSPTVGTPASPVSLPDVLVAEAASAQSTSTTADVRAESNAKELERPNGRATAEHKVRSRRSKPRTTTQTKRTVGKPRKRAARSSHVDVETVPEAVASGLDDISIPAPSKAQKLPARWWTKMLNAVKGAITPQGWLARKFRR